MVEFMIRIGSKEDRHGCKKPEDHDESVIVDYSLDNGINWEVIKALDPMLLNDAPQLVSVPLPQQARTNATTLRWWQPVLSPGMYLILLAPSTIIIYKG